MKTESKNTALLFSAEEVVARVATRSADLGMVPAVAMEALQLAKDPNCSIKQFAGLVERDAKLATDILCVANSAIYSPGQPILSLNQAVVRLGFQQCRNLILSTSMASLMKEMPLNEEWVREALCRHGYTTGLLAVRLNRALSVGFQGEEFTAGLMHDFGRMLFAVFFSDVFPQIDALAFDTECPSILSYEASVMGIDHCELGAVYAENNGLPDELAKVIRFHHSPQDAIDGRLTALVAVADHMANHLQQHGTAGGYDVNSNEAIAVLAEFGVPGAPIRISEITEQLMEGVIAETEHLVGF